jgi:hypothetical protein
MKSVTAGDEVAADFLLAAILPESDPGQLAGQVMDAHVTHFEQQRAAVDETAFDQILYDLLLAVDGDTLVHQFLEVDAVQIAVDADIDAPMQHAFPLHPFADTKVSEQVRRPMLDQAGANSIFDVIAAAVLNDD